MDWLLGTHYNLQVSLLYIFFNIFGNVMEAEDRLLKIEELEKSRNVVTTKTDYSYRRFGLKLEGEKWINMQSVNQIKRKAISADGGE